MSKFIAIIFTLLFFSANVWAAHYDIDADHTTVGFSIRHLAISKVKGHFGKFGGFFEFDPANPKAGGKTEVAIETNSIDTGVKKRDDHLRSADFFDAAKFPKITFVSKKVTDATDSTAKLEGDLTIHGITKPVVLNVELGGVTKDPWGNKRAAFSATTKINRKDFGLKWNKTLETGGLVVGEDVEVSLEVEGLEKAKN